MKMKEIYDIGADYMYPDGSILCVKNYKEYIKKYGKYPSDGISVTDPNDGSIIGFVSNEDFKKSMEAY